MAILHILGKDLEGAKGLEKLKTEPGVCSPLRHDFPRGFPSRQGERGNRLVGFPGRAGPGGLGGKGKKGEGKKRSHGNPLIL